MKRFLGFGLVATLLGLLIVACQSDNAAVQSQVIAPAPQAEGYRRAEGPLALSFPADHGSHPDYQTEWWYYTGNLETAEGRHFGYQLTFFRRALTPAAERVDRSSAWATDQVYLAHFALTDVDGRGFQAFERFSRGAAELAGAQADPYAVWLEDWGVQKIAAGHYRLSAAQDNLALNLEMIDTKGPILQGDQGYSQKGPEAGNASYYISFTRLETAGSVQVGDQRYEVVGLSWMDHEYSTSALSEGQVGWDWFSIQLDDGSELMVFQIRRVDGSVDPFSSGTLIGADGGIQHLDRDDFVIEVTANWRSPHSGAEYPAAWTLSVPTADLTLQLEPHLADQELNVSYSYWEGAVAIVGSRAGQPIAGHGYVELTGYADSMGGQF